MKKALTLTLLLLSLTCPADEKKSHLAESSAEEFKGPDSWKGVITNFSRKKAKKVAAQLIRNIGCTSLKDAKSKEEAVKAHKALVPKESGEVVIHAKTLDKVLKPSQTFRRFRNEILGNFACKSEVIETVFDGDFGEKDQVELSFDTPTDSGWRPLDVGWVTTDDKLHSLEGLKNCATGDESPADRSSNLGTPVATGYAIQEMGYMFRGHVIHLPTKHLETPQASGWHTKGPNIWGAFTKNAGKLDVKFGPIKDYKIGSKTKSFDEAATIDVTGIRWGLDKKDVQKRLEEEIASRQKLADDRYADPEDRARARAQVAQLKAYPSISLHNNDQKTSSKGTELFILYDKNQKVDDSRPVFYHTLNGARPARLAANGNDPRTGSHFGQIA